MLQHKSSEGYDYQRQHGICQLREQAQYRQAGFDKENG